MAAPQGVDPGLRPVQVTRVSAGAAAAAGDHAAVEEPLEIRLGDAPLAVIMRTPGADPQLAAGFLLAERIIGGADDLGAIRHCTDPDGTLAPNVVSVTLAGHAARRAGDLLAGRRAVVASSACGVCGRKTIDDLLTGVAPNRASWRVRREVIASLPDALQAAQSVFARTGGLHAAALFDADGRLTASAEDVGRHNAVDKVIGGELLLERLPLENRLLFVSGRTSYEIVQKAIVAGIPIVASVSAPSSLAIELAAEAGLTLIGFVRGGSFNVYAGGERVDVS